MTTTYLTIPEDRLEDVAMEVRRALEDGAYLDDEALRELRRVGQYEANPLAYLGWIGTPGWYLDEDGHSHYVAPAAPTLRVTDSQIARVRCAQGHAGSTTLVAIQGGTAAECQGCGTIYTAEQVLTAKPGIPGEGGVILR